MTDSKYAYVLNADLSDQEIKEYSDDPSVSIRTALLNSERTLPLFILEKLAKDKNENVRGAVAFRGDITKGLKEIFFNDKSVRVKELFACNDVLTEAEIIRLWKKSRNYRIKDAIRRRADMTQELWDKLNS